MDIKHYWDERLLSVSMPYRITRLLHSRCPVRVASFQCEGHSKTPDSDRRVRLQQARGSLAAHLFTGGCAHKQTRVHSNPALLIYIFSFKHNFLRTNCFQAKRSSLFTDEQRAYPSRITAQRRHRRRRAAGTRCEDSFQIKTLRKPFLLSLVVILPWFLPTAKAEPDVLASAASEDYAHT